MNKRSTATRRRESRRLRSVVVQDADSLVAYLEARRDLFLDGEEWEGATAAIDWLKSMIEYMRHNAPAEARRSRSLQPDVGARKENTQT